jgi:DNA-binding CsgD family transcriptional regulator
MNAPSTNSRRVFLLVNEPPVMLVDVVTLTERTQLVGRERSAAICLPDSTVSREHAELDVTESTVTVRDLQSLNGTFIDDEPVTERRPVEVGQHLRFGRVSFELVQENAAGKRSRTGAASTERWRQKNSANVSQAIRSLSKAERAVLKLMIKGHSHKEIAKERHISVHTVNNHLRKVYEAFGVHSRAELLALVLQRPLLAGRSSEDSEIDQPPAIPPTNTNLENLDE